MDTTGIKALGEEIVAQYGPWTATNVHLGDDVDTIGPDLSKGESKTKRFVQIISDLTGKSFSSLRVFDLACLEGGFAIEFAMQGAESVGIEGRKANLEKARFVQKTLDLTQLEFHLDDVRNLSTTTYGKLDVVLCSGILYHLDIPDVFQFLSSIESVCKKLLIIDAHVSVAPKLSAEFQNRTYWGRAFVEHFSGSSDTEKEEALWASLDNPKSFGSPGRRCTICCRTSDFHRF